MGGTPVTLDFSKAQPINQPPANSGGVTLDFSKAQPLDNSATPTPAQPQQQPGFLERTYEQSGIKGLIDAAKQKWEASQEQANAEQQMADSAVKAVKSGNYGQAAELLLNHLKQNAAVTLGPGPALANAAAGAIVSAGKSLEKHTLGSIDAAKKGNYGQAALEATGITPGFMGGQNDATVEDIENKNVSGLAGDVAGGAIQGGAAALGAKAGLPEAESGESAAQPGFIKKAIKGESVAQEPATKAVGSAAQKAASSAGVEAPSGENALNSVGEAGDSIISKAKAQYQALDEATGGRVQRFQDRLDNIHDQLSELTGTEEDSAQEAKLLKAQKETEDAMNDAFEDARAQGIDPATIDQAKANFKQGNALKDLDMQIFRSRVVEATNQAGESNLVNPQKLLPRLQQMYKSGRLTEAMGGDDTQAIDLLKQTSDFAKMGKSAARIHQIAKTSAVAGATAIAGGTLGHLGWELVAPRH